MMQKTAGAATISLLLISCCPQTLPFRFFFLISAFLAFILLLVVLLFEEPHNFLYEPEFENYRAKTAPSY